MITYFFYLSSIFLSIVFPDIIMNWNGTHGRHNPHIEHIKL